MSTVSTVLMRLTILTHFYMTAGNQLVNLIANFLFAHRYSFLNPSTLLSHLGFVIILKIETFCLCPTDLLTTLNGIVSENSNRSKY